MPVKSVGLLALTAVSMALASAQSGNRVAVSLDGTWEIADSLDADAIPQQFSHHVPVPGLAHLATPAFPDVDKFDSRELIDVEIRDKKRPESERTTAVGVPHQNRNYFWYRRTFDISQRKQTAILQINKAQFGTKVWLNGKEIGEHFGCFSSAKFEVTKALNWSGQNTIVVRIGAHPAAEPNWVPTGTDKEKYKWTPGIYDSVSIALANNPIIESLQVAPHISTSSVEIEAVVRNVGDKPVQWNYGGEIHLWNAAGQDAVSFGTGGGANDNPTHRALLPGEKQVIRTTIKIPDAKLWTPEHPNLYTLTVHTNGDEVTTRFGMREFRFDTATKRAYLNGQIYFLRGSNIGLHRFFEDPLSKGHPWEEAWVRRLLVDIPKQMHWNSFRLTLGAVPQFWLDIADEAGLIIQPEFPIWYGHWDEWKSDELVSEFSEWMRDQWNHPSVSIWDASNETHAEFLRDNVIPKVRPLDLSGRPWDNGYTLPMAPNDPVEDHPYFFIGWWKPNYPPFQIPDLEKLTGTKTDWNSPHPTTHPFIINEYGWLWLNRDGSPTLLTDKVYQRLLPNGSTPEERLETYAYLLGGLTEFWRAHRNAAGVQYFVYLTCSYPGVKTSDNFRNVETLELEPHFADYVEQAFRPLGVYLNFWQPTLAPGSDREYDVMVINDDVETRKGTLTLAWEKDGRQAGETRVDYMLPGFGQQTYPIHLKAPMDPGKYVLKASAMYGGGTPTVSRRKVDIR